MLSHKNSYKEIMHHIQFTNFSLPRRSAVNYFELNSLDLAVHIQVIAYIRDCSVFTKMLYPRGRLSISCECNPEA